MAEKDATIIGDKLRGYNSGETLTRDIGSDRSVGARPARHLGEQFLENSGARSNLLGYKI